MYPYLEIFHKQIPSYGTLLLLGFAAAFIVAMLRHKINGLSKTDTLVAMFMVGAGALIGGKLFHVIQGLPGYFAVSVPAGVSFIDYFNNAGLVYYGGFIGAILMLMLFCAVYKEPFWRVLDALLPSLPLAQAIGRVGCFLAGCCWGMPYEHGFFISPNSPIAEAPKDVALLPVQLIESACTLVLFIAMTAYGRKVRKPGKILALYCLGYGITRFVLEFFRYDAVRGFLGSFSVSQWISLILIAAGIFFWFFYRPKKSAQAAS